MTSAYDRLLALGGAALLTTSIGCRDSKTNSGYNATSPATSQAGSSTSSPREIYQSNVPSNTHLADYYANMGRSEAYQEAIRMRDFLRTNRDGNDRARFFNETLQRLGPNMAVDALLISQSPNIPLPPQEDEKYDRILTRMSEKYNMNLRGLDQEHFKRAFFQNTASNLTTISTPEGLAIYFAGDVVKGVLEQTGNDEWSSFYRDVLVKVDPASEAYFTQSGGQVPSKERAQQLLLQGYTAVMYENEIQTHTSPYYQTEQRSGSITGETVTREINPLNASGDPGYRNTRPTPQQSQQERGNQIDRESQDALRREGGRAVDDARRGAEQIGGQIKSTLDNIFKPKDQKK